MGNCCVSLREEDCCVSLRKEDLIVSFPSGPRSIVIRGNHYHLYNNVIHRENDLPAIIQDDGKLLWYKKDVYHRLLGSADMHWNYHWYFNNQKLKNGNRLKLVRKFTLHRLKLVKKVKNS